MEKIKVVQCNAPLNSGKATAALDAVFLSKKPFRVSVNKNKIVTVETAF